MTILHGLGQSGARMCVSGGRWRVLSHDVGKLHMSVTRRAYFLVSYRVIRDQPGASWPNRIRGQMCGIGSVFGLVLRILNFVFDELNFLQ